MGLNLEISAYMLLGDLL